MTDALADAKPTIPSSEIAAAVGKLAAAPDLGTLVPHFLELIRAWAAPSAIVAAVADARFEAGWRLLAPLCVGSGPLGVERSLSQLLDDAPGWRDRPIVVQPKDDVPGVKLRVNWIVPWQHNADTGVLLLRGVPREHAPNLADALVCAAAPVWPRVLGSATDRVEALAKDVQTIAARLQDQMGRELDRLQTVRPTDAPDVALRQRVEQLEGEIETGKQEILASAAKYDETQARIAELTAATAATGELRQAADAAAEKARATEAERDQVRAERDAATARIAELTAATAATDELRQEADAAAEKARAAEAERDQVRAERDAATARIGELTAATAVTDELRQAADAAAEKARAAEAERDQARAGRDAATARIGELTAATAVTDELRQAADAAAEKARAAEAERDQARAERDAATARIGELTAATAATDELRQAADAAADKARAAEAERDQARAERDAATARIGELTAATAATDELRQAADAAADKARAAEAERDQARAERDAATARIGELTAATAATDELRQAADAAAEKARAAEAERDQARAERDAATARIGELTAAAVATDELRQAADAAADKSRAAEAERDRARAESERLNARVEKLLAEQIVAAQRFVERDRAADTALAKARQAEEQRDQAQAQLAAAQIASAPTATPEHLEELRVSVERAEATIAELRSESSNNSAGLRGALTALRRASYVPAPLRLALEQTAGAASADEARPEPWLRVVILDRDPPQELDPLVAEMEAAGLHVWIASHPEEVAILVRSAEVKVAICDVMAFRIDQNVAGLFRSWEKDRLGLQFYVSFNHGVPAEAERARRVPMSLLAGTLQRPLRSAGLIAALQILSGHQA